MASGNPSTDGVTVGTYASVYTTAGAVAATFVAQITARDATTITIDVTTLKWGVATSVSEVAAASTLKVSGAWASELVLAATGLGTFTVPVSTKINIKAGTYTVTASRTITIAGLTATPVWFSGYNTTPGDLDNDTTNSLAKPVWSFNATFSLTIGSSANFQLWSGLSLLGNRSGFVLSSNGQMFKMHRCRVENTSSNAAAFAVTTNSPTEQFSYCWFKAPTTGTTSAVVTLGNSSWRAIGCVFEGGGKAGCNVSNLNTTIFLQCVFIDNTGNSILATTGNFVAMGCTFSNSSSDAIKWTGTPSSALTHAIVGCLFRVVGGYGINNSSGTTVTHVYRACNDFYSCTSGAENGFGDMPAFFGQTDSSDPVVSASDMTPVVGSNARANGFPGIFENESFSSYLDIGAVQRRQLKWNLLH